MGILSWGIGLGLMMAFIVLLFPTISAIEGFAEVLETPIYQALLGDAADAAAFVTPEGFLAVYGLVFLPLYLAVYLVLLGIGATAGEEDRGTIDLLLSTPIPRWQLIVEKYLALLVIVTLVVLLTFAGIFVGILLTPEMRDISIGRLFAGAIGMIPIMMVIASIALLASTVFRSRMAAGGITGAIVIASYLITNLAGIATEALGTVKYLSFFTYYPAMKIMREGIVWSDFLWMSALALILFGLALVAFQRRDLYV
jgi:ABC-2 type transport system permease protein